MHRCGIAVRVLYLVGADALSAQREQLADASRRKVCRLSAVQIADETSGAKNASRRAWRMNLGWKLFALESIWATLRPTRIAGSIMGSMKPCYDP